MEKLQDMLDEYGEKAVECSKYYKPVVGMMVSFTAIIIVSILYDFYLQKFNLTLVNLLLMIIPVLSLIFVLVKHKIGWVLSTSYYSFIFIFLLSYAVREFADQEPLQFSIFRIQQFILIILSVIIDMLFLSGSMRRYFKIQAEVMALALAAGIFFALTITMDN